MGFEKPILGIAETESRFTAPMDRYPVIERTYGSREVSPSRTAYLVSSATL